MSDYPKSLALNSASAERKDIPRPSAETRVQHPSSIHDVVVSAHSRDIETANQVIDLLRLLGVSATTVDELGKDGEASTVVLLLGPQGLSDTQAECHKPRLSELAQRPSCKSIALLLPRTEESDLPEWLDFQSIVRLQVNVTGLASVSNLYRAIHPREPAKEIVRSESEHEASSERTDVKPRLERLADYLGRDRKVRAISQLVSYLRDNPDEVHKTIPSLDAAELLTDWCSAETYFASDVLRGRVDMTRQFTPNCYVFLERVWLDQAKRLRAYLIWNEKRRKESWQSDFCCYMEACKELSEIFHNGHIKAGLPEFLPIAEYLADRYLHRGKLDTGKSAARDLVQRKAWCIWKCLGEPSNRDTENWRDAIYFAQTFYENIGPAIETKDPKAVKAIHRAIQLGNGEGYRYHIMDCFEAALIIYFLDPEAVDEACGPGAFSL